MKKQKTLKNGMAFDSKEHSIIIWKEPGNKIKHRIFSILFILAAFNLKSQSPADDPAWNAPYLFDGFPAPSLNLTIWDVANTGSVGWDNQDFGFYPERVNIISTGHGGSVLELSALNDNIHSVPISSGMISSKTAYSYGYFEARINFACTGNNYMPAFWLFNAADTCPTTTMFHDEIDIEIGTHPSTQHDLNTNFFYKRYPSACTAITDGNSYLPTIPLEYSYHKYGIEWMPGHVVIYYDDKPIRIKEDALTPDHPMKIWLDVGFSGQGENHVTPNTFPGYMYVDYVSVSQIKMTSDCSTANVFFTTPFNSSTYDYKVKKTINFNVGNSTNLTSGNITLRASEGVTINGDFTINGAEFTILPTGCY
ncbi:MAG: glycoside hydrolase family 16 protein [Bacteroidota bacterium]|nr:glycoside hydrolase family 16 protein [Bacteroidota bacterium]